MYSRTDFYGHALDFLAKVGKVLLLHQTLKLGKQIAQALQ